MRGAPVPITPVYEDGDTLRGKHKVSGTTK